MVNPEQARRMNGHGQHCGSALSPLNGKGGAAAAPGMRFVPFVRVTDVVRRRADSLRGGTDGHQNIPLTVKLYGHLQPATNPRWMNKLSGASKRARVASSKQVPTNEKSRQTTACKIDVFKSGTRDSNPRLQPWQGKVR